MRPPPRRLRLRASREELTTLFERLLDELERCEFERAVATRNELGRDGIEVRPRNCWDRSRIREADQ
jgi:hypothetical protein